LVLGHVDPDGDCIASQLLLAAIVRRLGRRALLHNDGPFARPEIARFGTAFQGDLPAAGQIEDLAIIVVDCSTAERTGRAADMLVRFPCLVIDHHASGIVFGDVRYVDPGFPSVTLMALELMDRLRLDPTEEEAELILFGLCTDTAFFRHLGQSSARVFTAVARLVSLGASPQTAFHRIYGGRSLEERRLIGSTLAGTQSHHGGRILYCYQGQAERGAMEGSGGSEEVYRLLQTVAGVRIVVLVRQESGAEHSVSLRSDGLTDVGIVARTLGGGGHPAAAGCTLVGDPESIRRRILTELGPLMDDATREM
jgi:phosphoesterase RecJ-like protein